MPYRKEQFVNGEIYHIVVRSIDDNLLFKNIDDYYRGIFSIYEFNNANSVTIRERRQARKAFKKLYRDPTSVSLQRSGLCKLSAIEEVEKDKRDRLVDIFCFCLMPNHLHLLLKQLKDGGITEFMKKVNGGYGGYFNRKYGRKGYVFQNRFVSVHIETDEQLKIVFVYIHTNPISLIEPKWKELGIRNPDKVLKFLENYKWSSYPDYIGKKNFPSVTERDFMLNEMNGEQGWKDFIEDWVRYKGEIKEFPEIVLE